VLAFPILFLFLLPYLAALLVALAAARPAPQRIVRRRRDE
jgi:hypothetical protein